MANLLNKYKEKFYKKRLKKLNQSCISKHEKGGKSGSIIAVECFLEKKECKEIIISQYDEITTFWRYITDAVISNHHLCLNVALVNVLANSEFHKSH